MKQFPFSKISLECAIKDIKPSQIFFSDEGVVNEGLLKQANL